MAVLRIIGVAKRSKPLRSVPGSVPRVRGFAKNSTSNCRNSKPHRLQLGVHRIGAGYRGAA